MKKIIVSLFLLICLQSISFAQKDSLSSTLYAEPDFKGFQIDASSILLVNTFGIAFDFDIIKSFKDPATSFGIRLGSEFCDKYTRFDLGGSSAKVDFFDFNFYPRLTTDTKTVRVDVYAGGTFHHISTTQNTTGSEIKKTDIVFIKGGLDVKIKLYKNYIGLIGKLALSTAESYGGIGLFIGYGKEYK